MQLPLAMCTVAYWRDGTGMDINGEQEREEWKWAVCAHPLQSAAIESVLAAHAGMYLGN